MIRTNIYYIRFSASQGFVWFWVVLAHESGVKMSARLPSSEGLTGAGIFASKMLLAGGLGSTPHGSGLLICLQDQGTSFLQNKWSKKEQGRTFMVACHSFFFLFFATSFPSIIINCFCCSWTSNKLSHRLCLISFTKHYVCKTHPHHL